MFFTSDDFQARIEHRMSVIFSQLPEKQTEVTSLATYIRAVSLVILDYHKRHHSFDNDGYEVNFSTLSLSTSKGSYGYMQEVLNESGEILLGLLHPDFEHVLEALTWANHLAHCTGKLDGVDYKRFLRTKHAPYRELSGNMILDYGAQYGITYELIDSISQNSIEEVFPEVMNYI